MKKYVSPNKLQFVGKAWEIRYALRQERKQHGGLTLVSDLIADDSTKRQGPGKA
ncbi:Z-ring formation inhibitor MciZ [Cohnella endophytica]|uniref:Z-ring formation inhibitor MciZ n=1 Tax=Cohnella endophytica TaxID=2419778 RepID=A0A494Y3X2_9BACL|nr:Z-ring formation inhibitor MciZ [Cohnella endophytica]RKP57404.1 Z-ring formation inhibitor MciZ [Cohnella endophytica]